MTILELMNNVQKFHEIIIIIKWTERIRYMDSKHWKVKL